jgi:hypothetical protein
VISEQDLVSAAQDAYLQSKGNRKEFERIFRSDSRIVSLSPIVIALLVKIAFVLVEFWMTRGSTDGIPVRFRTDYQQVASVINGCENKGESNA